MYTKPFLITKWVPCAILITLLAITFISLTDNPTTIVQAATDTFDCTTVSEIPQIECEALVDIYNSTDGPNWTNSTGWLATTTPCSWLDL